MLTGKDGITTDDKEIADVVNDYFINITKSLVLFMSRKN